MSANRARSTNLVFQTARFEELIADKGLKSEVARAHWLGVDKGHYHRVANGKAFPGATFVGAVMRALPHISFHYLFVEVGVQDADAS